MSGIDIDFFPCKFAEGGKRAEPGSANYDPGYIGLNRDGKGKPLLTVRSNSNGVRDEVTHSFAEGGFRLRLSDRQVCDFQLHASSLKLPVGKPLELFQRFIDCASGPSLVIKEADGIKNDKSTDIVSLHHFFEIAGVLFEVKR